MRAPRFPVDARYKALPLRAGCFRRVFAKPNAIIRMGIPPVRIEIQTQISGVVFNECYEHRIQGDLDGEPVTIIDLNHLKKNKRAAGRNKDLADLDNLP